MHANFVHLRSKSSYSLAEGAIKVDKLVKMAAGHNMPAIAIADSGNLFCSLEFSKACLSSNVQPIIGCDIRLDTAEDLVLEKHSFSRILVLAKNEIGYKNLLHIASSSFLENDGVLPHHTTMAKLEECAEGLICLTGGMRGHLSKLLLLSQNENAEKFLLKLHSIFKDDLFIEISRHGYNEEIKTEEALIDLAYKHNIPLVATNEIYYATPEMHKAHDALLCIANGNYVSQEDRLRLRNEHYFKSAEEMMHIFRDLPEAVENTVLIAKKCTIHSKEHPPMLPSFSSGAGTSEMEEFKRQSVEGLNVRIREIVSHYPDFEESIIETYNKRLEYELDIISKMNFPGYFLIVSDFIKWSKRNNIPVGPGRGSGAGSLVAWSLEITDIDPIKFGLLFERFLNPERVSMPDFDIDFCQDRRDEVINYVQEKYGTYQVAQIITFGKLQARAVIRDVGRVLQLPYSQVDKISKLVPFNAVNPVTLSDALDIEPALKRARDEDPQIGNLINIALQLEGLHRHASTHAAGVVIAGTNLIDSIPLYKDAKSKMLVVQYSMKYAEAAGLVKFDFLGLKTLTVIANTIKLIQSQGKEVGLSNVDFSNQETYKLLEAGHSVGVFQFESAGMRDALRKMRPDCIEDLIALGALYRPGPMDNIPTYIACKHGMEKPDYLHPKLESILKETFGVIIYQEQVMEIAQVLAGYTLGAADLLRRAMGKKIKEEMDAQRELFVNGAIANGVEKDHASYIFDLVAKFAGYGFNKSHAAAYGLISYQTAYLKANFTIEFIIAYLNLDIDDTDKIFVFMQEAELFGIKILPPDINRSSAYFKIEDGAIRYGLGAIKNVGINAIEHLIEIREAQGGFKDIADFFKSIGTKLLNKRQLENLIKAGAFSSLNPNKKQLFDSLENLLKYSLSASNSKSTSQLSLFQNTGLGDDISDCLIQTEDWPKNVALNLEYEAFGFYLTSHPLDDIKQFIEDSDIKTITFLKDDMPVGNMQVKIAGVIHNMKTRVSPRGRFVSAQISDHTGIIEASIYDDEILIEARNYHESRNIVLITAEARKDDGGIRISVHDIDLFSEELAKKSCLLNIWINNIKAIEGLKEDFDSFENGKVKVKLNVISADKLVEIKLPASLKISPEYISGLGSIEGVTKYELTEV